MDTITIFGITIQLKRVAFTIPIGDGWDVYWYGIILSLGLLLAMVYCFKRARSFGINTDRLIDVVLVTVPAAILGARLYYCIFFGNITSFFSFHDGGLAILGAVIASALVGCLMCKWRKVPIASALDLASLGFLIGQAIGRWGNFVNQEAYGTETGSSWFGMTGNIIEQNTGSADLVHPCFLYESLWCAAGFLLLHFFSKKRKFNGQIACMYLVWYGAGRAVIEGLRTDSLMLGNIRISQMLSILMVIGGIILLTVFFRRHRLEDEGDYTALFEDEEGRIYMDGEQDGETIPPESELEAEHTENSESPVHDDEAEAPEERLETDNDVGTED